MTLEIIRDVLAWCSAMDIGLLICWISFLTLAHDWVYRIHSKWFKLSEERFDTIHYAGIALFKICVFLFNIIPYLALRIVL